MMDGLETDLDSPLHFDHVQRVTGAWKLHPQK